MNDTLEVTEIKPQTGEPLAFERLYELYRGRVFNTAYRMLSNRADAEDVTQDVFVKVFKKLSSFRGESAVSTWIYRIAVNACLDFRRRRRLRQTVSIDDGMEVGSTPLSVGRLIESALPKMAEGYRQVFVLHDIQGLKHEEIGKILGITDGASKSQLHRARAFLRRELAPYLEDRHWMKGE
ncbi:MAG TPA: sigma-70 family RNA polymerase sigma factor [bacterium]|nr:sigma-70 family RNA polymerase sigma factor [bacterium]